MKILSDIGELGMIERITRSLPGRHDVTAGAGDDCAIVRAGGEELVMTSDPVISGVHFLPDAAPEAIGRKAIGRVLSDIAAMGAEPRWVLVDIVAPGNTPIDTIDGIYRGMSKLASEFSTAIVGGDMAEGPCLELHIFGVGAAPKGRSILRSTAAVGDILFVTGNLGGSRLGRHLQVEPRINEGIFLRKWASAMIDVSDGIASDLRHLIDAAEIGCNLNLDLIPLSDAAKNMQDEIPPIEHALYDGEDFELLFTIPPDIKDTFMSAWKKSFNLKCTEIGMITSEKGLIKCRKDNAEPAILQQSGYSHFKAEPNG